MDPISIAAMGIGAIGDILNGFGQFQQGKAQGKALEAGARQTLQESGVSVQQALDEGDALAGRGATQAAASGGGITGSAFDVLNDISRKAMFNAHAAVYRGETEANNALAQAEAARAQGKVALITGLVKGGGTVLGGIAAKRLASKQAMAPSAGKTIRMTQGVVDQYSGQY